MIFSKKTVADNSDSLACILAAQCADLELLLALARREETATRDGDFEAVAGVVGERAAVGERLEVYHRQVVELRERLGETADAELRGHAARRAVELVGQIRERDSRSRVALESALDSFRGRLARVGTGQAGLSAYLRDPRTTAAVGTACDHRV